MSTPPHSDPGVVGADSPDAPIANADLATEARLLTTLQKLLDITTTDLAAALTEASNVMAAALDADKVDAFLYDESRDSLVAVGCSTQPLSNLQKRLGLDVLPISNGGRSVAVFRSGETFLTGAADEDAEELRGIKEGLGVRSQIGVPLQVGEERRGALLITSQSRDFFTASDARFAESAVRWLGQVAHRAELVEEIRRWAAEQGRRATAKEIVTVLSHELRNYLAPLSFRLQALSDRAVADGRRRDTDDLDAAFRVTESIEALITDLLDIARIERGLFELDYSRVDLAELAKAAANELATSGRAVNVAVATPAIVFGDLRRLRQCLDNLITNAANHSPRGSAVTIRISETVAEGRAWGQIEIVDSGPGIPADLLPHIFDQYVTSRAGQAGLGLGLYLAKRIVSAHGGAIHARSDPGGGARFTMCLPAYGR